MRNDESTVATLDTLGTESFAQVRGGAPLTTTASPRFASIGVNARNPNTGNARLFGAGARTMTTTELCVSLQAGEIPESEEARAPVDIIVALDKSGSMQSNGKLNLCKKTLNVLLRQLLPQDRFGLITYSHSAQIAVPIRRLTAAHKESAAKAIKELRAGGGTNMSSAVGLSAQEMQTIEEPNPVQTVFFLTDGHANSGISDVAGLANLVRNCFNNTGDQTPPVTVDTDFLSSMSLQSPQLRTQQVQNANNNNAQVLQSFGVPKETAEKAALLKQPATKKPKPSTISLHTFGYGADHNGGLLREMASASEGGSYYFIEEDKDVGSAFGDALGGVLSVVAQNATVTLTVPVTAKALGVEITQVHHDQAIRRDNESYTVTLGDFYAEELRDLVVTVNLATPQQQQTDPAAPIPHLAASLSYTDTLESRLVQGETVLVSIARPSGSELSEENPHVAAQAFRVFAAKEMEEAEKMAAAGRFKEAKSKFGTMQTAYAACSASVQAMPQAAVLFEDAKEMASVMDDEGAYRTKGQATLNSKMRTHKTQRATVSKAGAPLNEGAYKRNKKRGTYSASFSTF